MKTAAALFDAAEVAAELALELRDAEQLPMLVAFERDDKQRTTRVVLAPVGELPTVEILPEYDAAGRIAFATIARL